MQCAVIIERETAVRIARNRCTIGNDILFARSCRETFRATCVRIEDYSFTEENVSFLLYRAS